MTSGTSWKSGTSGTSWTSGTSGTSWTSGTSGTRRRVRRRRGRSRCRRGRSRCRRSRRSRRRSRRCRCRRRRRRRGTGAGDVDLPAVGVDDAVRPRRAHLHVDRARLGVRDERRRGGRAAGRNREARHRRRVQARRRRRDVGGENRHRDVGLAVADRPVDDPREVGRALRRAGHDRTARERGAGQAEHDRDRYPGSQPRSGRPATGKSEYALHNGAPTLAAQAIVREPANCF